MTTTDTTMKKVWKNFFRKSGRVSDHIISLTESASFDIRQIEWDTYETLLEINVTQDKQTMTILLAEAEARRIGAIISGFAASRKEYERGLQDGYRMCIKQRKERESNES